MDRVQPPVFESRRKREGLIKLYFIPGGRSGAVNVNFVLSFVRLRWRFNRT